MVMALGCVGTGWLDDLDTRLAVGFLATAAPWKSGPSFGLSIDGACAVGKPGMGSADVVLMPPVYAMPFGQAVRNLSIRTEHAQSDGLTVDACIWVAEGI